MSNSEERMFSPNFDIAITNSGGITFGCENAKYTSAQGDLSRFPDISPLQNKSGVCNNYTKTSTIKEEIEERMADDENEGNISSPNVAGSVSPYKNMDSFDLQHHLLNKENNIKQEEEEIIDCQMAVGDELPGHFHVQNPQGVPVADSGTDRYDVKPMETDFLHEVKKEVGEVSHFGDGTASQSSPHNGAPLTAIADLYDGQSLTVPMPGVTNQLPLSLPLIATADFYDGQTLSVPMLAANNLPISLSLPGTGEFYVIPLGLTIPMPAATNQLPISVPLTGTGDLYDRQRLIVPTTAATNHLSVCVQDTGMANLNNGQRLTVAMSAATNQNIGQSLTVPIYAAMNQNNGQRLSVPTSAAMNQNIGQSMTVPMSAATSQNNGQSLTVPMYVATNWNNGQRLTVPMSAATSQNNGQSLTVPMYAATNLNNGHRLTVPMSAATKQSNGQKLIVPTSAATNQNNGQRLTVPLYAALNQNNRQRLTVPMSAATNQNNVQRLTVPTSAATNQNNGHRLSVPMNATLNQNNQQKLTVPMSAARNQNNGQRLTIPMSAASNQLPVSVPHTGTANLNNGQRLSVPTSTATNQGSDSEPISGTADLCDGQRLTISLPAATIQGSESEPQTGTADRCDEQTLTISSPAAATDQPPEEMITEMQIMRNSGRLYYNNDGYFYYLKKIAKNRAFLFCAVTSKCPGRARMPKNPELRTVKSLVITRAHSHPPTPSFGEAALLRRRIMIRCRTEATPYQDIYDEEVARAGIEIADFPDMSYNSLSRTMQRCRIQGRLTETPPDLLAYGESLEANNRFGFTKKNQPFYRGTLVDESGDVAVVFVSEEVIDYLDSFNHMHVDATFRLVPSEPPCHHLMTIASVSCQHQAFPMISVIMGKKSETLYFLVFTFLHQKFPRWKPKVFTTDYERMLQSSLRRVWPKALVVGSWAHSANCMSLKAHRLGHSKLLWENEDAYRVYKMAQALAFLPSDKTHAGYEYLVEYAERKGTLENLATFLNYVFQTWLTDVGVESFSVFQQRKRLINDMETYHRRLQGMLKISHPNIWTFTDVLRQLEFECSLSLSSKKETLPKTSNTTVRNPLTGRRGDILTWDLDAKKISIGEFLENISRELDHTRNKVYNLPENCHSDDESVEGLEVGRLPLDKLELVRPRAHKRHKSRKSCGAASKRNFDVKRSYCSQDGSSPHHQAEVLQMSD